LRMKLIKTIIIAAIIILTGSSGNEALAQSGRGKHKQGNSDILHSIPDLTEAQRSSIKIIQNKHQKELELLRKEKRSTTDEKVKARIKIEMDAKKKKNIIEIKKQLTPDQEKYYDKNCAHGNNCNGNHGMHMKKQDRKGKF